MKPPKPSTPLLPSETAVRDAFLHNNWDLTVARLREKLSDDTP